MKLSFVIPAYNEEDYIEDCLGSILAQMRSLPYDIEVVVVNNASTDKTEEIVRRHKEVKLVYEKKKASSARVRQDFSLRAATLSRTLTPTRALRRDGSKR